MKRKLLLPHPFKAFGWILLPFAITFLVAVYSYNFSVPFLQYHPERKNDFFLGKGDFLFQKDFSADLSGEAALLCTFVSLFIIAFSAEKNEDEYVSAVRLHALQVSVYFNYFVLAISSILIYGLSFLMVMELNLFTILVLFILVFNFNLHIRPRFTKSATA
ncbi:MAG: hypothetical protein JSS82_20495 [Bacteroidetes bacterium]|nr:hypothetical protein [Bacteroidota bacterium]